MNLQCVFSYTLFQQCLCVFVSHKLISEVQRKTKIGVNNILISGQTMLKLCYSWQELKPLFFNLSYEIFCHL
jgi:hypothetical protein